MSVIEHTPYSTLIPNPAAEAIEIEKICARLSEKYFSDDELDAFAANWFPRIGTYRILSDLSSYFDEVTRTENDNRNAQANITRLILLFTEEIYKPAPPSIPLQWQPPPPTDVAKKTPQSLLSWTADLIGHIVRYPLYLFTRIFGSLNLAVSTFTSLDRSFWIPFFPHATVSLLITLPIDILFIATAVFQFQWFECSLFANALKVGHKREIEPALKADRTTIKVTGLYNENLIRLKQFSNTDNAPSPDVSMLLDEFSRKFSCHVLSKAANYQEYKEPLRQKSIRWGLNLIGGFLVCCLNAFTFKYTIAAFATSHAVMTLFPWLSILLCTPAAISILTTAAVIYGLVYYSAKRSNSPDHYHLKFIHNRKKIDTFKRIWTHQKNYLQQQEVIYRQGIQNRIFYNEKLRDTYSEVFSRIRANRVLKPAESSHEEKRSPLTIHFPLPQHRLVTPTIIIEPEAGHLSSDSSFSDSSVEETPPIRVCTSFVQV